MGLGVICGIPTPFAGENRLVRPVQVLADILSYLTYLLTKLFFMGGLLYIIAVILIICWAIGYFGYHAGGIIHVLLVIALIAFLLRISRSAD